VDSTISLKGQCCT